MVSYNQTATLKDEDMVILPAGGEGMGPGEDTITIYPVWASFNVLITLSGGLGNCLLIHLSLQRTQLVTSLTQLLVAQCVLNLSDCVLAVPVNALLVGTRVVFSSRDAFCRVVLSWLYATWSNFCFSLLLISILRLLYVTAPLRMHKVRERIVVWTGCSLLVASQLAWLVSSLLVEEQPFGSSLCVVTGRYHQPSSSRLLASVVFNLCCVLFTLGLYTSLALGSSWTIPPAAAARHRNIITARTGMIQCVFLLATFLMPILTRLASYWGLMSPTQLSRGNMFFIKISQCTVYPIITIACTSALRREAWKVLEPLRTRLVSLYGDGRRTQQPASTRHRPKRVEPSAAVFRSFGGTSNEQREPVGFIEETTVSVLFAQEFLKSPLPVDEDLRSGVVPSSQTRATLWSKTRAMPRVEGSLQSTVVDLVPSPLASARQSSSDATNHCNLIPLGRKDSRGPQQNPPHPGHVADTRCGNPVHPEMLEPRSTH